MRDAEQSRRPQRAIILFRIIVSRLGAASKLDIFCGRRTPRFLSRSARRVPAAPGLIRAHIDACQNMRVYRSKDRNGIRKLMILDDPDPGEAYVAYFDLKRSTNKYADI